MSTDIDATLHSSCNVCNEGYTYLCKSTHVIDKGTYTMTVPYYYRRCDTCKSEYATSADVNRNTMLVRRVHAVMQEQL